MIIRKRTTDVIEPRSCSDDGTHGPIQSVGASCVANMLWFNVVVRQRNALWDTAFPVHVHKWIGGLVGRAEWILFYFLSYSIMVWFLCGLYLFRVSFFLIARCLIAFSVCVRKRKSLFVPVLSGLWLTWASLLSFTIRFSIVLSTISVFLVSNHKFNRLPCRVL